MKKIGFVAFVLCVVGGVLSIGPKGCRCGPLTIEVYERSSR